MKDNEFFLLEQCYYTRNQIINGVLRNSANTLSKLGYIRFHQVDVFASITVEGMKKFQELTPFLLELHVRDIPHANTEAPLRYRSIYEVVNVIHDYIVMSPDYNWIESIELVSLKNDTIEKGNALYIGTLQPLDETRYPIEVVIRRNS